MSSLFRFNSNLIRSLKASNIKEFSLSKTSQHFCQKRNLSDDIQQDERVSGKLENVDGFKCLNRVTLLGRATGPANVQLLGNTQMASFTLATNELRRNKANELIKRSDFHKIQVFIPRLVNRTQQIVQKGSRILVEGKISYNVRRNEEGHNIHFTNITAENIVFITGNRAAIGNTNPSEESDIEEMKEQEANQ